MSKNLTKNFYETLDPISQEFINEVDYRVRSAQRAVDLMLIYQKRKRRLDEEAKSITFISARFAIMELCALLDGRGRLAMKLHRDRSGNYTVQRDRLCRLFPSFDKSQISRVEDRLSPLIASHSRLIDRLLHTRNQRLGHAGISRYVVDEHSVTSFRFPRTRFEKLAWDLWHVFIPLVMGQFEGLSRKLDPPSIV